MITRLAAAALLIGSAAPATAGVYSDDLGKCMVKATSADDRTDLIRWVYMIISASPKVAPLSKVSEAERKASNVTTVRLMERLVMQDCRPQSTDAFKYEGVEALKSSFGLLGQVAMTGLVGDPVVAGQFESFGTMIDKDKWTAFGKEIGVDLSSATAKPVEKK